MNWAFYLLAGGAVLGAGLAVTLRNVVHAVLSLLFFFTALAGIFLLLQAEFIAAVQVLVYVGAVGILILFAVMLTRDVTGAGAERAKSLGWAWGLGVALALFFLVLTPAIVSGPAVATPPGPWPTATADLGRVLMTEHVVALQVIALLLTAALVGAVVIALEDKS